MYFSLTNSPATFQTMMNDIFKSLIDKGYIAIYVDVILIFTRMIEHHQEVVSHVLDTLQRYRLYLKADKCSFECSKVEDLGLILSEGCIEMDPVKIAGVKEWPTPKNVTEVQSFVSFINFYRRFIPDFSHVAKPLNQLTKKGEPWRWSETEEGAFHELKRLITSAPVLVLPDQKAQFRLKTDASGYAMGAILSQLCDNGTWHSIGFTSKSLNLAEHNYMVYDKELLSIICGLEEWRHIIEGTEHTIKILNDHRNLMYF